MTPYYAAKLASPANVVKTWMYQVPQPLYDCVQLDTHADKSNTDC